MGIYLSPLQRIVDIVVELGVYMESGFFEYLSTATCSDITFKPAQLHYNADIAAYMAATPAPLQGNIEIVTEAPYFAGENLAEGESQAVGCPTKAKNLFICDTEYSQESPTYCGPELRRIKFIQQHIKPSVFTGKLRAFVQGVYGSTRRDYETIEDYPTLDYPLFVGGEQLHYLYNAGTSGILTGSDYRYFLVKIAGTATAKELIPSSAGEKLRDHLIIHAGSMSANEIKRIETYILSTCKPSGDSQTIDVDLSSLAGEPIAYGWHFNWSGSKADIILHQDMTPSDDAWNAHHHSLIFTESDGLISASLSSAADGRWYAVGDHSAVAPEYLSGNMINKTNSRKPGASSWDFDSNWDGAVYCYYDDNDELIKARLSNSVTDGDAIIPKENFYTLCGRQSGKILVESWQHTLADSGSRSASLSTKSISGAFGTLLGSWTKEYFEFGGFVDSSFETSDLLQNKSSETVCGGTGLLDHAFSLGLINDKNVYSTVNLGFTGRTVQIGEDTKGVYLSGSIGWNQPVNVLRENLGTHSDNAEMQFVAPFDDANTAFVGKRTHALSEFDSANYQSSGGKIAGQIVYYDYYKVGETRHVIAEYGPFDMDANQYLGPPGTTSLPVPDPINDHRLEYTSKTEQLGALQSSDSTLGDEYFDIEFIANPIAGFHARSKQSIGGAYLHEIDNGFGLVNVDYPHDTAVGWA